MLFEIPKLRIMHKPANYFLLMEMLYCFFYTAVFQQ